MNFLRFVTMNWIDFPFDFILILFNYIFHQLFYINDIMYEFLNSNRLKIKITNQLKNCTLIEYY